MTNALSELYLTEVGKKAFVILKYNNMPAKGSKKTKALTSHCNGGQRTRRRAVITRSAGVTMTLLKRAGS